MSTCNYREKISMTVFRNNMCAVLSHSVMYNSVTHGL